MNPTQQFLGEVITWPAVRLRLLNVHPLWGGCIIGLNGHGQVILQMVSPGQFERRYTFNLSADEVQALLALFIAQDFISIAIPTRTAVLPDEARAEIRLTNSAGQQHTVARWAHDSPNVRLAALLTALHALEQRTQTLKPDYEGPYRPLAEDV